MWINEFAPRNSQTAWMAFIQLTVILGGAAGSIIGSIAADNKELGIEDSFTWRHTNLFPAGAFLLLALTWYCQSNNHLDTQAREKET